MSTLDKAPWLVTAVNEMGQKEIKGKEDNPRILEYHMATTLKASADEVPWCASFVCWVLQTNGYKTTKSAWARDWMHGGLPLVQPHIGCVVVFQRGKDASTGHVAFYMGEFGDYVIALGGNQADQVCIRSFPRSNVLGYREPVSENLPVADNSIKKVF